MYLLKVVKTLAKKSTRRHTSRLPANRARPHLEGLETRMAPSSIVASPVDPTLQPPPPAAQT
jgi:hypothetical protein